MALVPMSVQPGELLITTEKQMYAVYNTYWNVPKEFDGCELRYGDLMTVVGALGCRCGLCADPLKQDALCTHPAWVLHHRMNRLIYFADISAIGWLFRPDPNALSLDR